MSSCKGVSEVTEYEQEMLRLLTQSTELLRQNNRIAKENNTLLRENQKLLVNIDENIRKIKFNTIS